MLSKSKRILCAVFAALNLLTYLPTSAFAANTVTLPFRNPTIEHIRVVIGNEDGTFKPDTFLTRAEASQMVYRLLEQARIPSARAEIRDVSKDDWYYDALGVLALGGILPFYDGNGGAVKPNKYISRAEFVTMLVRLVPSPDVVSAPLSFPDLKTTHTYYEELVAATTYGWLLGYPEDGKLHPDGTLTRAEAVTIINRALGHVPNEEKIDYNVVIPLYSDLSKSHWAYYDIMEASLSHSTVWNEDGTERWYYVKTDPLKNPGGFYDLGDFDFCYVDPSTGLPIRNAYYGGLYFGADGKYTSGDAVVDSYVKEVLRSVTKSSMTKEQMLRAAYNYTRDSFTYLKRNYYEMGDVSWAIKEAKTMFTTKRGNCYCYAAVFYFLARQLGYDAVLISGKVNNSNPVPHGWVEIAFDGVFYMYDPELEMSYRKKGVYYYDFYHMAYSKTPWKYWR